MRLLPTTRGRPTYPGKGKPSRTGPAAAAPLAPRQKTFILRWMVRRNSTRAYMDAYPDASYETARTEGSKLFRDPRITSQLRELLAAEAKRLDSNAHRVTEALAALAFASMADVVAKDGSLLHPTELPRDVALAVKKVKGREIVSVDPVTGERQVVVHIDEVELHDKTQALRLLGIEHGMFPEKVAGIAVTDMLLALRKGRRRGLARGGPECHTEARRNRS